MSLYQNYGASDAKSHSDQLEQLVPKTPLFGYLDPLGLTSGRSGHIGFHGRFRGVLGRCVHGSRLGGAYVTVLKQRL